MVGLLSFASIPNPLSTPVLAITSTSAQPNPAFTIDMDDTVGAGDIIELQIQVTGGSWTSFASDTIHTITSGEDGANEVDLSLSALSSGTYDARCDVSNGTVTSAWSNTVTFVIS